MEQPDHNGYEKRDINVRVTALIGILTVVALAVSFVALDNYFTYVKETEYREMVLEVENRQLIELRLREDSLLTTYELVDTADSRYRIPIEQAIEMLVTQENSDK